jgi:transposase-like protein
VEAFRTRPLRGRHPYLWLDAKVDKVRDGGRSNNKALVTAQGADETGGRDPLDRRREAETDSKSLLLLRWSFAPKLAKTHRRALARPIAS